MNWHQAAAGKAGYRKRHLADPLARMVTGRGVALIPSTCLVYSLLLLI